MDAYGPDGKTLVSIMIRNHQRNVYYRYVSVDGAAARWFANPMDGFPGGTSPRNTETMGLECIVRRSMKGLTSIRSAALTRHCSRCPH